MRIRNLGIFALILTLSLDQLTKWAILGPVALMERSVIEITSFFNLAMVWNTGVSFGMGAGTINPIFFIILSLVIIGVLALWLTRAHTRGVGLALGLVIGGAAGNVIDRVRYGAVADFLDFHLGTYHWPAFNIADSAIFIGVVVLCADSMFTAHRKQEGSDR